MNVFDDFIVHKVETLSRLRDTHRLSEDDLSYLATASDPATLSALLDVLGVGDADLVST